MRIDSHQHFWSLARGDYGWLTPNNGPIYRDFGPRDLRPILREAEVHRTIVVQAAPTIAETRHLLSIAQEEEFVAGVVGWVDMDRPERAIEDLERLSRNPKFRGIRPMIQDIADVSWILGSGPALVIERLIDLDLRFDALVRPVHLSRLLELLARYPELAVVVDHGGKPNIAERRWQPWADRMESLAEDSRAYCKLSGLLTESRAEDEEEVMFPYMNHLLRCFGPERLMWGSDWPVLNLVEAPDKEPVTAAPARCGPRIAESCEAQAPGNPYRRWHGIVQYWLQSEGSATKRAIEGESAAVFYGLENQSPGE